MPAGSRARRSARPRASATRLEWHGEVVVWPDRGAGSSPTTPGVCGDQPMMEAKEACGVFGVYAPGRSVAHLIFDGLYALQHRGQESAGMAVSDGDAITVMKDMGLVTTVFDERKLSGLRGHLAIGHTRYSTAGSSDWMHAQPVFRGVAGPASASAHNGNLTNTAALGEPASMLPGLVSSDSDLVAELLAQAFPPEDPDADPRRGGRRPRARPDGGAPLGGGRLLVRAPRRRPV